MTGYGPLHVRGAGQSSRRRPESSHPAEGGGSPLVGRLWDGTAFERRVVSEDQHQDRRQEREERDGQKAGEAASRVLQVAHSVGSRKSREIADRIDQRD